MSTDADTGNSAPDGTSGNDRHADSDLARGLLGAGLAVTAWSTGTILAKYIEMDALAIGAYRFATFFIIITTWMIARGQRMSWRIIRYSMAGGLALGADIVLFFSAVKETSVVNATIIGSLQPIVVGVVAARFFGEKIRRNDALWSLLALAGAFVVVRSAADNDVTSLRGDLLALLAMFSWSAYFIFSKESRRHLTSTEFTAGTSVWTAATCVVIGLPIGQDFSWPSAENWGWLALMILGAGIIGHTTMNWSLQRIPLWVGSTFTLFIPVASTALAWLILDEQITLLQGVAMAAVIAALAMIVRGQTKPPVNTQAATAPTTAVADG